MEDEVLKQDYNCPRCGSKLQEKRPKKDKFIILNKNLTVRFFCPCGYYRDEIVDPKDFI